MLDSARRSSVRLDSTGGRNGNLVEFVRIPGALAISGLYLVDVAQRRLAAPVPCVPAAHAPPHVASPVAGSGRLIGQPRLLALETCSPDPERVVEVVGGGLGRLGEGVGEVPVLHLEDADALRASRFPVSPSDVAGCAPPLVGGEVAELRHEPA